MGAWSTRSVISWHARSTGIANPIPSAIDLDLMAVLIPISFPRIYLDKNTFDFSLSGLKTAVLYYVKKQKESNKTLNLKNIAASFQQAVIEVLTYKTLKAAENKSCSTVTLSGGVAANKGLRNEFCKQADKKGINMVFPPLNLCTDNAAMIAYAGFHKYQRQSIETPAERKADILGEDGYATLSYENSYIIV